MVLSVMLGVIALARFSRYIKMASRNDIDPTLIPSIVFWNLANMLVLLLPFALMFGVALSLIRLHTEGELSAWYNCGLSRARLGLTLLTPAVLLLPASLMLALLWAPVARERVEHLVNTPGRGFWVQHINTTPLALDKERMIFAHISAHDKHSATLRDVTLVSRSSEGEPVLAVANNGKLSSHADGKLFIHLSEGSIYRDKQDSTDLRISHFGELQHLLHDMDTQGRRRSEKSEMSSSIALWRAGTVSARAELFWRLNTALAAPVLAVVAWVLMGGGRPVRHWRSRGLLYVVFGYWAYMSALIFARDWGLARAHDVSTIGVAMPFTVVQLIVLLAAYALWRYQGYAWRQNT